jgi:GTPase SAR1 family protein
LTDDESLKAIPRWKDTVLSACDPNVPLVLVGNKSDLQPTVTDDDVNPYVQNMPYYQTSAENGSCVDDAFTALVAAAIARRAEATEVPDLVELAEKPAVAQKSKCC